MAAKTFAIPTMNNYPSVSPFSSKFLVFQSNYYPKFEMGTSFFGEKPRQLCEVGAKTTKYSGLRNGRMRTVSSLGGLLGGIFKGTDTGESTRKQYAATVSLINGLEAEISQLTDLELRERTSILKERAQQGQSLDSLLPEAFAVVREASRRVLGLRPFLQPEEALLKKMMADQEINNPSNKESKPLHPLNQIAESPTHKLLLKQWFKEEELILGRIALKETQIDTVRKEITQLYCFFFLFHSLSLLLLFSSASSSRDPNTISGSCHRSWIPSVCSLLCSLVIIWAIRYKTDVESHMEKLLEREKEDSKLLSKCVQELKLKGVEFDLLKEVDALRRAKSLRIEAKAVRKWSARDFVTLFFVVVSCLVLGLTRVVLCS